MDEHVLKVRMLGEFSITCGEAAVSCGGSRSYRAWHLLAYLICDRDRQIPPNELIRLLGDNEANADPGGSLRYTVWRVRRITEAVSAAAGAELIVSEGGIYGCNPLLRVEVDAERFESLCRAAMNASDDGEKAALYREALPLYRGDFLSAFSGEAWAGALNAHYHNLYLSAAEEAVPLLAAAGDVGEAVLICRTALRLSPFHEPLCRQLMRLLMKEERWEEAVAAYKALRDVMRSELDVSPDEETQTLYRDVLSNMENRANEFLSPEAIREQLRGSDAARGAMICNYADFKLFYQAEARSAARRGDAIHIGILTVAGKENRALSGRSLKKAMEQLQDMIQDSLRMGDVAATCSASQYILMLVQANYENSVMVCRRVAESFARAHPHSPAWVHSVVLPLEPLLDRRNTAGNWETAQNTTE